MRGARLSSGLDEAFIDVHDADMHIADMIRIDGGCDYAVRTGPFLAKKRPMGERVAAEVSHDDGERRRS